MYACPTWKYGAIELRQQQKNCLATTQEEEQTWHHPHHHNHQNYSCNFICKSNICSRRGKIRY